MKYRCPFCSHLLKPDDSARGYSISCAGCGKSVAVPITPFEPGCVIGDFLIEHKLGKGSIGSVFKAVQISLDRVVALKVLSHDYTNKKGIADFLKEARAAARLNHTNIVQALAVGEDENVCYMAMNYITGETLKAKIQREGKIPVDEALHIVQQVAEALYYAWDEAKLIHRDVKPENIMITEDGIVKLTDLGLAIHQTEWNENLEISGSPSYMSPEQFAGEKLDSRSDIYSLGVTLFQMLAGKLPFDGGTIRTIATQHINVTPPSLSSLDTGIPSPVSSLAKKMLAKLPDDRFASMEELLNAIWRIRQKTAPNKDMVPDIHTISINRLDYSIQNKERIKNEEDEKTGRHPAAGGSVKRSKIVSLLLALYPAVIVILLITCGALFSDKIHGSKLKSRVENFKAQMDSGKIPYDVIEESGGKLLSEIGIPRNEPQERCRNLLLLYLAEHREAKLQSDLDKALAENKALSRALENLKKEKAPNAAK